MQAIFQTNYGDSSALTYGKVPLPKLQPKDVMIKNYWTGINPIDFKVRNGLPGAQEIDPNNPLVLGWDGAGVVTEVGPEATGFKVGDEVYYAGSIVRGGSYAQYTAVDSRIVSLKPKSMDFDEAASIPLVAITSWETLIEDAQVEAGDKVLIYNGAGGLGSFAIQLARHLETVVVATASRPETIEFCQKMGAQHIINHREPLKPQMEKIGIEGFDMIFHCHDPTKVLPELVELLNPFGRIACVSNSSSETIGKLDTSSMHMKRQTLSFTFMFARSLFGKEPERQGKLLKEVADLIDSGVLKSSVTKKYGWQEMASAHQQSESGKAIGKIVVEVDQNLS
eukprot:TRINITY_DN9783_c0_g1_i10.p1 TRINITY_DN9783_c0_g1~~TRINITY_DN9783_c0_g1_i10.p1  ORF type:complete len:368 (+),score=48.29 TRINITY_DN9783_c0_g1_i10:93-1106(+)